MSPKTYLGDGVYIYNDGWHVVLETIRDNGMNTIFLEPDMITGLIAYAQQKGFQFEVPQTDDEGEALV